MGAPDDDLDKSADKLIADMQQLGILFAGSFARDTQRQFKTENAAIKFQRTRDDSSDQGSRDYAEKNDERGEHYYRHKQEMIGFVASKRR
jgi:hypothetical protein